MRAAAPGAGRHSPAAGREPGEDPGQHLPAARSIEEAGRDPRAARTDRLHQLVPAGRRRGRLVVRDDGHRPGGYASPAGGAAARGEPHGRGEGVGRVPHRLLPNLRLQGGRRAGAEEGEMIDIGVLAKELDDAVLGRREIEPLTKTHGEFDLKTAYAIQRAGLELRAQRGERAVGYKLGFSSEAKRQQMELATPIYGYLTHAMSVQERVVLAEGIHPRVEPEIAFVTATELRGDITFEEALRACATVAPALEILDSRFVGFKYFSVPDVIADNCSSWRCAPGQQRRPCAVGDLL